MSKDYRNYGYLPVNPYQCPTNFYKAPPCPSCADKPVCEQRFDLTKLTGPVAGFKHESWVTDDCVDVGDGVVRFRCGSIDLSKEDVTYNDLKKAIVAELRAHKIPDCKKTNADVETKILECNIILRCEGDELVHEAKQMFTHFVLEDGTELAFEAKKCNRVNVCTYEQFLPTGKSQADIEAELTAAGVEFDAVTVDAEAIPADGDAPAQDKVTITLIDGKLEVPICGKTFNFCGCKCEYRDDEPAEETEEEETEEVKALLVKTKEELIAQATAAGIEVKSSDNKKLIANKILGV